MGGYDRSGRRRFGGLRIASFLVLLLLCGVAAAEEDDEAARRFAREELLRVAAEQVAPHDPSVGGIKDLRLAMQADRERLAKLLSDEQRTPLMEGEDPETLRDPIRRLDELIGLTEKSPGGPTQGLIRQGARLHRYVIGGLLPTERGKPIEAPDKPSEQPEAGENGTAKDGPPKNGDDEGAGGNGEPANKEEGGQPDAEDQSAGGAKAPEETKPEPRYTTEYMPEFQLFFPDGRDKVVLSPIPPTPAERKAYAASHERLPEALRDAELRIAWRNVSQAGGAPAASITLEGIEELAPHAGATPDAAAPRWVLVRPDELVWKWGVHYVNWRRWQVEVRRRTLQQEETKGLVNDAQVDQKALRAERFASDVAMLTRFREEIVTALESMRKAERHWLDEADRLELKVEEIGQRCDNCSPDELVTFTARQDLAKLRGTLVQQELRLLYITALRAGQRLAFVEESLQLAKEEAQLAKTVHQRFVDARNRARRGRQLASLQLQRGDLREAIKEARTRAGTGGEETRWGELATQLERMARINEELQALVQTRRRLEQSAAPPAAVTPAGDTPPAVGDKPKDTAAEAAASTGLPVTLRRPGDYFIDNAFVADARKHLGDPSFDRALVAEHHAVVDDVVKDLQDAMGGVADLDARQARIQADIEAARAGLGLGVAELRARWPARRMYKLAYREGKNLKRLEATFDVTMRGIRDQQERIRQRIEVLLEYREQLENLGLRSFGIRTDRTLSFEGLQVAGDDAGRALGTVGSWLTGESKEHGGHFLQRHWQALALLVLAIVSSVLIVRLARRAIDGALQRMVASISHLPNETVAIGTEAAEVREQRAAAETARREAEKAALAEASGEAERKRAVSGSSEGGGE
jgi:hypothetical protein